MSALPPPKKSKLAGKRHDRFSSDVNHFFTFSRRFAGIVLICAELPRHAMRRLYCVLAALIFVMRRH